jgi:hypothetical protein
MPDRIKKLENEIRELELKLKKDHFGTLFDRNARRKEENRLKKLRKELEKLKKGK